MTHSRFPLSRLGRSVAIGSLLTTGLAVSAGAQALTVISFGGASGDAMQQAYYGPFLAPGREGNETRSPIAIRKGRQ
ncbi:hypothetical protein [Halomonas chromatireducens]|uniref:Uncharacterized protein n=1 Tax=Halomonas chromatireducens TaxID=507626 RepID=A0A0X8HF31_9GAMM|nr:hypothetical protein [Halomonas chromatireducens]AMD01456.1 hypothetical protein LOKO_02396 [Halomonas chromatireducens]